MSAHKRTIFLWALYDFANSVYPAVITATIFGVYFTRQIVGNETGLGDLWWGRVISVSMLFVALSSPSLGTIADRAGIRKRMLLFYTCLCVVCVTLFTTIQPGMILWAVVLAVLANIGFEGALVYYNAYLPDIAPTERQGSVSAIGFGFGYAGSAIGLLIALPLVARGRFELTWLTVAAFFVLFSLPSFLGLPPDRRTDTAIYRAAIEGIIGFKKLGADVLRLRDLRRFLLAFFVYIDGVNTTIYFSAIFASATLGFTDAELISLFLVIQISALVGALAMAKPTDLWGPKRVISMSLILWTTVSVSAYFVHSKALFFIIAVLAGMGLGVVQAASRALMSALIPEGKEAEMFGFYAFCGKSSSVIGPLVFGAVSYSLGGNQRAAIFSVAAFFLLGFILVQRVRDPLRAMQQSRTGELECVSSTPRNLER
ncbi:MAG: MFS transporter [Gemmatimonadota bacterium]|nr:MAG: MFS transporter [Gemmatimonadota bacterium]